MKPIWWFLLGALIAIIVLKMFSAVKGSGSRVSANFKALAGTAQANNLIRTNEFRELVKTTQFRSLVGSLAEDEMVTISKALTGATI